MSPSEAKKKGPTPTYLTLIRQRRSRNIIIPAPRFTLANTLCRPSSNLCQAGANKLPTYDTSTSGFSERSSFKHSYGATVSQRFVPWARSHLRLSRKGIFLYLLGIYLCAYTDNNKNYMRSTLPVFSQSHCCVQPP